VSLLPLISDGSVVVDLRGNGGGIAEEAVDANDHFLPPGLLLFRSKHPNTNEIIEQYSKHDPLYKGPLIVIADETSASASEISAGNLTKIYGRALHVGRRTFGKGLAQIPYPYPPCMDQECENAYSRIKLSRSFYEIGLNYRFQRQGLRPHIEVSFSRIDEQENEAIKKANAQEGHPYIMYESDYPHALSPSIGRSGTKRQVYPYGIAMSRWASYFQSRIFSRSQTIFSDYVQSLLDQSDQIRKRWLEEWQHKNLEQRTEIIVRNIKANRYIVSPDDPMLKVAFAAAELMAKSCKKDHTICLKNLLPRPDYPNLVDNDIVPPQTALHPSSP